MSRRTGKPPAHGQISVSTLKIEHAKRHLASMTASAAEVRDYGGHSVTGEGSRRDRSRAAARRRGLSDDLDRKHGRF
ncbi:MAG: hypothetical protein ABSF15_20205 [Candidatus Sulfotelmatobacter sp.]|jgi:hypothetical protein